MRRLLIVAIIVMSILTAGVVTTCYRIKDASKPKTETCVIKTDMRKLWSDHAFWTREVIGCIVDNSPGKAEAIGRLLRNQDEIGDAIKPYYGELAAKELTRLLRYHIVVAADVVTAARDGNASALEKANVKWYANSKEIAEFLSKANPNLEAADMRYMMDYHLRLTTTEVVTRIQKNYTENVKAFDKVYYEVLEMSDMISLGIVKQFPEKFACDDSKDNGGHDHY